MNINGHTRLCGLIGNPVEHTKSPILQNYLANQMNINMAYLPFLVNEASLETAIKGAFALNVLGCNVTVPYKSDVIPYLVGIDEQAKRIGAVNTLVRTEEGFVGYNTDMAGLYMAMKHDGVNIKEKEVIILGAGGVARAVAVMLQEKGAAKVYLLNRTLEKARKIAEEVNAVVGSSFVMPMNIEAYDSLQKNTKYIVIQATSVGMYPNIDEVIIKDEKFYEKVEVGYDLIFNPMKTKFMTLVENAGGVAFNGLKMLAFQGVYAFQLWNNVVVSEELKEEVCKLIETKEEIQR